MQEKIFEKLCDQTTYVTTADEYLYENDTIKCMDSDEDLNEMEEKLIEDTKYRIKMIKELARLRGQNLSETVRKIMQALFTDKLLTEYSYIGFKGKKNFKNLQICAIIFETIQKIKPYSNTANVEIEKPLKNWMAQASNRIKKSIEKDSIVNNANII